MIQQISLSLPVADLAKSRAFFEALGFSHHPQFTGETAVGIAISEAILVMLLPRATFSEFSPKAICDASHAEVLLGIGCESRAQVDEMITKAEEAGGSIHERSVDYEFMYHGSFADLDGHLWALNYMSGPPPRS